MTTIATKATGRRWAYTGITLGGLVSIAANVAHSFVPPHGAPTDWHPQTGAVFGAIVWPVFLFIAIEILARTPWPRGARWWLLRFGGLLPVALVAAVVSYRHLSGLLAFYDEDQLVVTIGPAAVDGLMAMATGALLAVFHAAAASLTQSSNQPAAVTTAAPSTKDEPAVPAHLVPTARFAVTNHQATTGRTITAPELAARMSVSPDLAGRLLTLFEVPEPKPPVTAGINGTPTGGAQ
jgi:hypothetical protein